MYDMDMYLNNIYLDFEIVYLKLSFVKYACMVLRETSCNEILLDFGKILGVYIFLIYTGVIFIEK